MGVLTQFLLEAQHDLKVVELDQESVEYLEQNFPDLRGRIIAKDFLKLDLSQLYDGLLRHWKLSIQYIQPDIL